MNSRGKVSVMCDTRVTVVRIRIHTQPYFELVPCLLHCHLFSENNDPRIKPNATLTIGTESEKFTQQ